MPTKLIRSFYNLTEKEQNAVITIGNFDGVHLGHQALLAKVMQQAQQRNVPSLVITFEPHPFEFFSGATPTIPRITRLREKYHLFAKQGMQNVLILPFNQKLAQIPAASFVEDILHRYFRPSHIIVGDDFRFGHKRQGDFQLLKEKGDKLGFTVEAMSSVLVDDERISSTLVRKALMDGDHSKVQRLLGRPYTMLGRVCHGDKLGQQLGFPTANIHLHRKLTPVRGIYTVYMHVGNRKLPGAANVGTRPSVNGTKTLLEVHLLNFNEDIYGCPVEVEFCEKLRDEERYPNLTILQEKIAEDVAIATTYFKKQGAL